MGFRKGNAEDLITIGRGVVAGSKKIANAAVSRLDTGHAMARSLAKGAHRYGERLGTVYNQSNDPFTFAVGLVATSAVSAVGTAGGVLSTGLTKVVSGKTPHELYERDQVKYAPIIARRKARLDAIRSTIPAIPFLNRKG